MHTTYVVPGGDRAVPLLMLSLAFGPQVALETYDCTEKLAGQVFTKPSVLKWLQAPSWAGSSHSVVRVSMLRRPPAGPTYALLFKSTLLVTSVFGKRT